METSRHAEEVFDTKIQYEERANLTLQKNTREHISLMLKTFVWAVRSSMIRENLDEVDQYFTELVKQDKINEIVLVNPKGTVLISTNKKRQGKKFADFYPEDLLRTEDVNFLTSKETTL